MQNNKPTIYFSSYDDIKNPYYGGGGAVAVHEVAKRLTKNYNVRILSWDYCGKKKEIIDEVLYERFGLPFLSPKFAMFVYQVFLPFIVLGKQYDLWLESFCPPFTTAFLPLFTMKPVIGIVHMLAAEDMERKYKLPFHIIQNKGLKLYKNIVVTTEVLKSTVQVITPSSNITVISNAIAKVLKLSTNKENYILFLGRIEVDQKGIDLLLTAFSKFLLSHDGYKLIIAGSGSQKEIKHMQAIITKLNLKNSLSYQGKVSGSIKENLMKNASCIVIPSRFETYSIVALEAMAHGTPIVCFDIKGLSWVSKNIARKVKPFDINLLADAMTNVVTNKTEMKSMIENGNTYAKQFTWENVAKQYQDYITKLLDKNE